MKKTTRNILIISACCMGAGALISAAGIAAGGWFGFQISRDGIHSASSQSEPYTLEKTKLDDFSSIKLNIQSQADIEFLSSEDEFCYLEYTLSGDNAKPVWGISDGTLSFEQSSSFDTGFVFGGFSLSSDPSSPIIRLYIPEGKEFSDITIYNSYGNVKIDTLLSDTLTLDLDSGDLDMKNLSAGTADVSLDFGDLDMAGCRFTELNVETDSGNIEAEDTTADTIVLINSFGDSTLKNTIVRSADLTAESGSLYLEASGLESLTGTNEFGDTTFVLPDGPDSYSYDLRTEFGEISFSGDMPGRLISDDIGEMSYINSESGNKKIEFTAESGDIEILGK